MNFKLILLILLCVGLASASNIVMLTYTGAGGNSIDGYYTYPYYVQVGSGTAGPMMCDDFGSDRSVRRQRGRLVSVFACERRRHTGRHHRSGHLGPGVQLRERSPKLRLLLHHRLLAGPVGPEFSSVRPEFPAVRRPRVSTGVFGDNREFQPGSRAAALASPGGRRSPDRPGRSGAAPVPFPGLGSFPPAPGCPAYLFF